MYKLAVLFFLTTTWGKIINPKYDYLLIEYYNSLVPRDFLPKPVPVGKAWVLSLDSDVEALKLRAATPEEVLEVFPASRDSGPSPLQGKRLKKDDPDKSTSPTAVPEKLKEADDKAMLSEIMRVINKFALTTHTEPDAYLPEDNHNSPILQMYFKDAHTSLIVRAEGRRWHYKIGPPALFPEWFYEEHPTDSRDSKGAFVEVPKSVKIEFYSALFHMLTMFMSYPV